MCSIYGLHGTQNAQLELKVLTQKKVLKKHIGFRDIYQGEISVHFGPPGDHFGICSQSGDVGGE